MARPRRISDDQIDAASREVFLTHGFAAPLSQIAAQLGVSQAGLLHRAGSKEQLLLRALRPGAPEVVSRLLACASRTDARGELETLLTELLTFHENMLPGLMVLRMSGIAMAEALGDLEPPPRMLRRLLARWLESTERIAGPRCPVLAEALLGSLEARCFNHYLAGQTWAIEDHAAFVRMLVGGLVPELEACSAQACRTEHHPIP